MTPEQKEFWYKFYDTFQRMAPKMTREPTERFQQIRLMVAAQDLAEFSALATGVKTVDDLTKPEAAAPPLQSGGLQAGMRVRYVGMRTKYQGREAVVRKINPNGSFFVKFSDEGGIFSHANDFEVLDDAT